MRKLLITFIAILMLSVVCTAANSVITVEIDSTLVTFDVQPQLINGRTMVPMRKIFEALGADVTWDQKSMTATGKKDGIIVNVIINSNIMFVNGTPIVLDTAPIIIDGRTLVPVRAIAESFNYTVDWENDTKVVTIDTAGASNGVLLDDKTVTYYTYDEYINDCNVTKIGATVTIFYNRELPVVLKLSRFLLDEANAYVFEFGGNVDKVKIEGDGGAYNNVSIVVDKRTSDFALELDSITLNSSNSVITSSAPCLNLTFSGLPCYLSTKNGANGSNGESLGAVQIGNGGSGGNGGSANTVIVCSGALDITCGAKTTIQGGRGGNGGNGGDVLGVGATGGSGGNGGNGGGGVYASAITVTFKNGMTKSNIAFIGGEGGNGGAHGVSYNFMKDVFHVNDDLTPGKGGTSATGTNVTVQYK